ncbi:La domain [Plasmodiophora brassicae]|uniref:Uncharacterized protein n=1 Tax=Plasmodiophora brassicae TaxID=37360 RepID=A0A0G4IJ65_PLABS|nr:hypothetical protein PBRA_004047 [Plasmodiophora brassicae]SPQ96272.1 unnamed protein product [Plasmodiophora brassicae]
MSHQTTSDADIVRQVEFYFSDSNLRRDKFMKETLKQNDGSMPVSVLLTFKKVQAMTSSVEAIANAIRSGSEALKVSEDGTAISRATPFSEESLDQADFDARTVYVNHVPMDATIDSLTETMSAFGKVNMVRIPKATDEGRPHRGFAFVEFADVASVAKAVEALPKKSARKVESEEAQENEKPENAAEEQGETTPAEADKRDDVKAMYALSHADWKKVDEKRKKERALKTQDAAQPEKVHEKDRLVRITGDLSGAKREALHSLFTPIGDVKFVDFPPSSEFATIRFATAEIAKNVVEKVSEGNVKFGENVLSAALLTEEEQEAYWKKVEEDKAARDIARQTGRRDKRQGNKHQGKRKRADTAAEEPTNKAAKTTTTDGDVDAAPAASESA